MKNFKFPILLSAMLAFIAFASCSDTHNSEWGDYLISYGTVVKTERTADNFDIKRDDGVLLHISSNLIPNVQLDDQQRVLVNYTIIPDQVPGGGSFDSSTSPIKSYNVQLNGIEKILTKRALTESFILADEQHRNDSIGNDAIIITDAWFTGKYINIHFAVWEWGEAFENSHFLNMVYDDTLPAGEAARLTLRHKSTGPGGVSGGQILRYGDVSFDISAILPEGGTEREVELRWQNYSGTVSTDTGTFRLNATSDSAPKGSFNATSLVEK